MNIKRFFAPDMRRAINMARLEHGPDAVILSSESVAGGVEIIAAVDYDQSLVSRILGDVEIRSETAEAAEVVEAVEAAESPLRFLPAEPDSKAPEVPVEDENRLAAKDELLPAKELRAIQRDLDTLKGLVRERVAWSDMRSISPERAWILRRAESLGFTAEFAQMLASEVQHPEQEDRAWREFIFALARRLRVVRQDPLVDGGIFALVGPTGVGKTTTIAKLAARHCMEHGRESLALITTDNQRVGAHRQLDAYGAIFGVPVRTADSPERLGSLLSELTNRRLVLIDTAGVAPRDAAITEAMLQIDSTATIRRFLVTAANMQAAVMYEAVRAFGGSGKLSGAVLTKTDEANGLGAPISVLVESGLPAVWLSDGQKVPDDLKLARVADLLRRASLSPERGDEPTVPAFFNTSKQSDGSEINAAI